MLNNKKSLIFFWWQLNGKIKWRPLVNVTTHHGQCHRGRVLLPPAMVLHAMHGSIPLMLTQRAPSAVVLPGNARRQTNYRPVRKHHIFRSDRFDDLIMAYTIEHLSINQSISQLFLY